MSRHDPRIVLVRLACGRDGTVYVIATAGRTATHSLDEAGHGDGGSNDSQAGATIEQRSACSEPPASARLRKLEPQSKASGEDEADKR